MHIPEPALPYEQKTLVLVCDRRHARFYQAHERNIHLMDSLDTERNRLDDDERYASAISQTHFSKAEDETLKEREGQRFYAQLADKLFRIKQEENFEKLLLVIPHEDKNVLLEQLRSELKETMITVIPKELTKLPDNELIIALDKERRLA